VIEDFHAERSGGNLTSVKALCNLVYGLTPSAKLRGMRPADSKAMIFARNIKKILANII